MHRYRQIRFLQHFFISANLPLEVLWAVIGRHLYTLMQNKTLIGRTLRFGDRAPARPVSQAVKREEMSRRILHRLERGDFDELLRSLLTGRTKSWRHVRFFCRPKNISRVKYYSFLHSPLFKYSNISFLSDEVTCEVYLALKEKIENLQETLLFAVELPKNLIFSYINMVAEPEIVLHFLEIQGYSDPENIYVSKICKKYM